MNTNDSPVNQLKLTDRDEYQAFIHECLFLIAARGRLARKQQAEKPCRDEHTVVIKSMRRLMPLARALYAHLPGEHGHRLVRKGKNALYIDSAGRVWMAGHLIAWDV